MLDGRVGLWDKSPFSHWEASVGGVRSLLDSAALGVIRSPQHIITTLSLSSEAAILVPYFFLHLCRSLVLSLGPFPGCWCTVRDLFCVVFMLTGCRGGKCFHPGLTPFTRERLLTCTTWFSCLGLETTKAC